MFDIKYRPVRFADVLGNPGIRKLLHIRSRDGSLINQSMMLGGPKGCGKTTLARIIVKAIKCQNLQDGEPCNDCLVCKAIESDTYSGVEELDAASQGTIDKIRAMVRDADYGSIDGQDLQIYILDEAQRLSKAAQDALLKAIESRLFIVILCTTEPFKVQGPIRDRIEEYPVYLPPIDALHDRLRAICSQEQIEAQDDALTLIIRMNGGTPRSSILAVESLSKLGPLILDSVREFYHFDSYTLIDKILFTIDSDPKSGFELLDKLAQHEGPTWARDSIIWAIASGLRADVGAQSTYPVPLRSFQVRLRSWTEVSRQLGALSKPTYSDIEAILLHHPNTGGEHQSISRPPELNTKFISNSVPTVVGTTSTSLPSPEPDASLASSVPKVGTSSAPKPSEPNEKNTKNTAPKRIVQKSIEVDGVKFTASENLTSLDNKIEPSTGPDKNSTVENVSSPSEQVLLDPNRVPITDQEFSTLFRGFQ
jgi:DNA polymerase III subunit gamma/tau